MVHKPVYMSSHTMPVTFFFIHNNLVIYISDSILLNMPQPECLKQYSSR